MYGTTLDCSITMERLLNWTNLFVATVCLAKVSAKYGSTWNLFAHLQTKHPEMYVEVKKLSWKTEKA